MAQTWTIGRDPGSDLVVDDPRVSNKHCELRASDDEFVLGDLDSENGTFRNGVRIDGSVPVAPTDAITLAGVVAIPWPGYADSDAERIIRIGRGNENDVVVTDSSVSTKHARILDFGRCAVVEDLGSTNGVSLGDSKKPIRRAVVTENSKVYLGGHELDLSGLLRVHGAAESQPGEMSVSLTGRLEATASVGLPVGSIARENFDRIRGETIDSGILCEEDWDAAARRAAPSDTIDDLLDAMRHAPAPWDDQAPLLTDLQVRRIQGDRCSSLVYSHYLLRTRLGRGGMGEVFKAWDRSNDRYVAIKTIREKLRKVERVKGRFAREARNLRELHHANFPECFDAELSGERYFIAMELLTGKTLEEIMKDGKRSAGLPPWKWAVETTIVLAEALSVAHRAELIHRDIKPSNIMVTDSGRLKILDLGIARLVEEIDPQTMTNEGIGTLEYMSPEQCRSASSVTFATDIYSLGCTLFYLLTGRPPCEGSPVDLIRSKERDPPPRVRESRSDVPRSLEAALQKMLAKSPTDRFDSAQAVAGALEGCLRPSAALPRFVRYALAIALIAVVVVACIWAY